MHRALPSRSVPRRPDGLLLPATASIERIHQVIPLPAEHLASTGATTTRNSRSAQHSAPRRDRSDPRTALDSTPAVRPQSADCATGPAGEGRRGGGRTIAYQPGAPSLHARVYSHSRVLHRRDPAAPQDRRRRPSPVHCRPAEGQRPAAACVMEPPRRSNWCTPPARCRDVSEGPPSARPREQDERRPADTARSVLGGGGRGGFGRLDDDGVASGRLQMMADADRSVSIVAQ